MDQPLKHLAIIMDGNGRWAQAQGLKRTAGHLKGTENVRDIALAANRLGISALTVYAFSTENWQRPLDEINYLMKLPALFFEKYLPELMANHIKITMLGSFDHVPLTTRKVLTKAIEATKNNAGMTLNFAFNYGSKAEIIQAINEIILASEKGQLKKQVTESTFEQYLWTKDLPPVDLLIRTGGDKRLSNFLLWQLAYAELTFIEKAWPEFNANDLNEIVLEYSQRQRRFGGLK